MHIVHVHVHVKPEHLGRFIKVTLANARASADEAGIARFDVLQSKDDPSRFILVEVYRTPQDVDRHKATTHYADWAEAATEMLAAPRTRDVYQNVFPDDPGWG